MLAGLSHEQDSSLQRRREALALFDGIQLRFTQELIHYCGLTIADI